ncbi:MAG: glycosyltransferase family 1 protein [Acidobacteria bacterium]|nr:MAG: glycosyltransferase family 1 protein [Acidobacteriota bacterium]
MKPISTYNVVPRLPLPLQRLRELAYNLRWAWDHEAIELFRRLDSDLWEKTNHNPILMLSTVDQAQLEAAAVDEAFLAHLDNVHRTFAVHLEAKSSWFKRSHPTATPLIAYFSAEFGITESLSIFAGGLGVLAGDHLKSASDLGIPLVGVGLLYQQGYFRQYLNQAGWQQEAYEDNDFHTLPLQLELTPSGLPLMIELDYPGRKVRARVWRAQVGRVPLYLLDSNIPENRVDDRDITDQLYGGDVEMRIKQEILLGIGGYRVLGALGLEPTVYHMNEVHSAFLGLERVRRLMETQKLTFAEAREAASAGLVFTTHTPVPAGHDYFHPDLIERYLGDYYRSLGLSRYDFHALGRQNPKDEGEFFCMTVLSLRLASYSNAVSRLHGEVSRHMWRGLWPGVPPGEIPIGYVANGVHFQSWISQEVEHLYDRYLGPRWREEPVDRAIWVRSRQIPAEELWRNHERRRERLVAFARTELKSQLKRRNATESEIEAAQEVLDSSCLTIGFARRFATYKRATLLLRDPDRLARILNDQKRPVQVIFAGKAHPRDDAGKDLIRQIVNLARRPEFRRRLVFLEDYDVNTARYLVQGVDVWLNTPRRPGEASGTSGMKAAANGVLNLSTADGWWDQVQWMLGQDASPVGWTIGRGELYENFDYQDHVEAEALYELLERDVIPTFYDRGPDGVPRRWISRMKTSLEHLCHFFNTHRMVREYVENAYLLADQRFRQLSENSFACARSVAAWRERISSGWRGIRITAAASELPTQVSVGSAIPVRARVHLGSLVPTDVRVQVYYGPISSTGEVIDAKTAEMELQSTEPDGVYLYQGHVGAEGRSGLQGFSIRVLPHHESLTTPYLPGLIAWADA